MKKTYVLDTNILLADPGAILSFQNNDIVLPFVVLEELDKHKNSQGEIGLNAREVSRQLHDFLKSAEKQTMKRGISLPSGGKLKIVSSSKFIAEFVDNFDVDADKADNHILAVCTGLKKVILVTNDMLLRVKADACGILNQNYQKNSVVSNVESVYSGIKEISVSKESLGSLWTKQKDRHFLTDFVNNELVEELHSNEFVHIKNRNSNKPFLVRKQGGLVKFIPEEYELPKVKPRNLEQRLALDLLMDDSINLVTIVGLAGSGKASPVDTPTLTPTGWRKMGDIKPGESVISVDGKPTKVLATFPQGHKKVYKVTFSDGSSVECCKEHLWETKTSLERDQKNPGQIRTTEEIIQTLRHGKQEKKNHSIPMVLPVEFEPQEIELDPYVLGVMLGDGSMSQHSVILTTMDSEIVSTCNEKLNAKGDTFNRISDIEYKIKRIKRNNEPPFLVEQLNKLELLGKKPHEKFVPNKYKYNSTDVRLAILQGLMDTDGAVSKNGTCSSFTSSSEQLANDVQELVRSFGGKATITKRVTQYTHNGIKKDGKPSFRVGISMPSDIYPFRLVRKLIRFTPRIKHQPIRYITDISLAGVKESVCLLVDHPRHLYVTKDYIVTHNTLLALAAGLEQVIEKRKYKSLLVCRPVQPLGKDIGFLPGSIEEKMEPWIAPIKDNLSYLLSTNGRKTKNSEINLDYYFDRGLIEIEAMTYIRGRSIADAYMIIDEAQNLSAHELKTIITRAGEGTKIVLTGDIEQIDNIHVDSVSNGLVVAVERFKEYEVAGHVSLKKGERSLLATLAARIL